jgi:hypothetical protein
VWCIHVLFDQEPHGAGEAVEKTFEGLVELVKCHHNPKLPVIVQQFRFNSRVRRAEEKVPVFVAVEAAH